MKETKEEKAHRIATMFYEECMENAGIKNYPPLAEEQYAYMGEEEDLNMEGYE
tara:strand:- start:695 stop:853 length:159 start_codon:yes stop_codon:yes gene_type:complete